ncbi:MAG TPA: FAD-dependent oxidoreductase, partial [Candidatus Sulfotelmatobacter sp.]|nr:FAD-dependent oxidoreductase [Candidatus Sulfotelmatobacter sp.]
SSDKFESMIGEITSRKLEATGRKIAVVGAGPAGLTAAFYLSMLGHEVTVYDSKSEAGGMLRFALPEYRLPKSILRHEIELIERLGVKFGFNIRVGVDLALNDLDDRFDMIFLSIGTWKESWVYQSGTELKGVYPALNFLEAVASGQDIYLGRRVAVIGGGNAAIDSARTSLRKGCEVTVFYRRERKDMPAIEEETRAAKDEGAKFVFLAAPHRVIGDAKGNVKAIEIVKTRLGEYDSSGRRKPIATDEIQRFDCDSVIFAIGETVDLDFCRASGLVLKESGTIDVNRFTLETSRPRFYAGGDLVTGASNVSNAMAYGKQAARSIDLQLMEADRWQNLYPQFDYEQTPPEEPSPNRRHTGQALAAAVRVRSQEEVIAGLDQEEALDETCRCLRCDVKTANVS